MRQRFNRWWSELTLWALAKRREMRDCPEGNDLVFAILVRQQLEKAKTPDRRPVAHSHKRANA